MSAATLAVLAVLVIAALVIAALVAGASRHPPAPQRRRGPGGMRPPQSGEIWFVNFPFADDWTKSKDRPVLVVSVAAHTAVVRKITSQDQSLRPQEYELLPANTGLSRTSWVRTSLDYVALSHFRRRAGSLAQRDNVSGS
ncbi:MAG TPA: type II toxin-antitoxin system PemK/MazF family toxin [Mycobacteriales bacterium]|jgi:mRNA-degrading endonuclease toxin of MazEF toxin-antitoxin module|nr:type II toxin-antitoxin system PemK/MazF family toxin [Mycobacteriales bacterium]